MTRVLPASGGRLGPAACALLAVLAVLTASAHAQPGRYVITFDQVAVQGFAGIYDSPEVAHLENPEDGPPLPGRPSPGRPGPGRPVVEPRPPFPKHAAVSPLAFAPGQGTANPSFVQHGFLVESFWAVRLGSPLAHYKRAHFHPAGLASGFEAQHLGNPDELHGIYIRAEDGRPFGLRSLRYRVTRNRQLPSKPGSLGGFSNYDVNVLVGRTFDPRWTIRGQFVGFPVGLPAGNDPTLPWWTLPITGFEAVQQVFIASSASVDFDDIVLTRTGEE